MRSPGSKITKEMVLSQEEQGLYIWESYRKLSNFFLTREDLVERFFKKRHTRELMKSRYSYYLRGVEGLFDTELTISDDELRTELAKREHIPNKKEAKEMRREKAKRGKSHKKIK